MFRILGAYLVAPFPIALLQASVVGLWPKAGEGVFEHPASMFVAICLYFYLFGLLLGLPAWLAVRPRHTEPGAYALIGLGTALVPVGVGLLVLASKGQLPLYVMIYDLSLFGLGGVTAGAAFWLIAVRKKAKVDLKETFS